MSTITCKFGYENEQRGAALAASLIILLVITVLALAASQEMRLQGIVAHSFQGRDVALQSAEAALRAAERKIMDLAPASLLDPCAAKRCQIYGRDALQADPTNRDWWQEYGWTYTADSSWSPATGNWRPTEGRFIIFEFEDVTEGLTLPSTGLAVSRTYYRITAAGTSDGIAPQVILQSTVARVTP